MEKIQEFFAVTQTSVYYVQAKGSENGPAMTKIALFGKSEISVGTVLKNGNMIAICSHLIMYTPEGGGITSFERKIENVNTFYWGGRTSEIVALFKTKEEALACFVDNHLIAGSQYWARQTFQVIEEIGNDHPVFEVCHSPGMRFPLLAIAR